MSLQQMKGLPDRCVNCIITSPPYYGLRDYQVPGQLGLEPTRAEYLNNLIAVFHEARRVLRDDGTCFIVIGDSYARSCRRHAGRNLHHSDDPNGERNLSGPTRSDPSIPGKNLMLIPSHLGIALQEDNWWVRNEIIWHKKNPTMESVKDRFTRAHETIWFLSKSPSHYWNHAAAQEKGVTPAGKVATHSFSGKTGNDKHVAAQNHHGAAYVTNGKRNKRDVFVTVPDEDDNDDVFFISPNKDKDARGAHPAVFPEKLVEPLILAGCPEGGVCLDMFAGSGTVGAVALKHNRSAVLIELNPEYCSVIENRLGCTRTSVEEAAARLSPEERSAKARREAAMRLWRKLNSESTIGDAEKDAA